MQILSETISNMDETGLFAQIPAVRICDSLQVNLTARNDSDWLIRRLTLATLLHVGGGRLQESSLCQAFLCGVIPPPTLRVRNRRCIVPGKVEEGTVTMGTLV